MHWCNPLTLQPEQSGGVGLIPGRAPPLERHDKGWQTRLALKANFQSAEFSERASGRNFTQLKVSQP